MRRKEKTVDLFGESYSGDTIAQANENARANITQLHEAVRRGPFLARAFGPGGAAMVMAYAGTHGMQLSVLDFPGIDFKADPRLNHRGMSCTGWDYEHACQSAVRHAAQLAWSRAETNDAAFARVTANQLAVVAPERAEQVARDIVQDCIWQRAYRKARDAGATDREAHAAACRYRDTNLSV